MEVWTASALKTIPGKFTGCQLLVLKKTTDRKVFPIWEHFSWVQVCQWENEQVLTDEMAVHPPLDANHGF